MSRRKRFSILIVEDNSDWRHALVTLYEDILSKKRELIIDTAASGPEAIRKLRMQNYNLLSLDINLGSTHPRAASDPASPNLEIPGADGRTVLRKAKEVDACNGVIVITALDHDGEIFAVIPNEDEVDELRVALHDLVSEFYPGDRNLIFKKLPAETELESISASIPFLKRLTPEKLFLIGGKAGSESTEIPGPYILVCLSPEPPRIQVISQVDPSLRVPIVDDEECRFLYALGLADRFGTFVTNEAIEKIYGYEKAQIAIDSVTNRRLQRAGLDPKQLFRPVWGKGRKLHETVDPKKFVTTVSTRGPRLWADEADPDAHDPSDFEL